MNVRSGTQPERGHRAKTLAAIGAVIAMVASVLMIASVQAQADQTSQRPGAPRNAVAYAHDGAVTIGWEAPLVAGSPPFTTFVVINQANNQRVCETPASERSCFVAGLINGTEYSFDIAVDNGRELSVATAIEITPTPAAPDNRLPSLPQNVEVTSIAGGVKVTWTAPSDLGIPKMDRYTVTNPSYPPAKRIICDNIANELSCSVKVPAGKKVGLNVRAHNGAGPPDKVYVEGFGGSVASRPNNFTATPIDGGVKLNWDAPDNLGTPPLTEYRVIDPSIPGVELCRTSKTSCVVKNLQPGKNKGFNLVAINDIGNSKHRYIEAIPGAVASMPQNLKATATDGGAILTWEPPADLGHPAADRYRVINPSTGDTYCVGTTELTCEITGLTNGRKYGFNVVAINDIGNSKHIWTSVTPMPDPDPTVTAPATMKLGLQDIVLTGKDWPAKTRIFMVPCPKAKDETDVDATECDLDETVGVVTNDDGTFTLTVSWDVPATGLVFGGGDSDQTASDISTIVYEAPPEHEIVVRAKGERAEETFSVMIGNTIIGHGTTTGQYVDYPFTASSSLNGPVKVTFTNDYYDGTIDRNLWVDHVRVNGKTYESESSYTYSEGAWTSGLGCSPGFRRNERFTCGGTFTYTVLGASGGTTAPSDPYLPEEPAADEPAAKHVIKVRAKGHTGGERFAVRIGTTILGQVTVTNEWRTYRFKLDELPTGKLFVAFMNDSDDGYNDFNLQIDYVKVDDQKHESEDSRIYMAGPGPDAACTSGHKQSETLYCSSAFYYADL